MAYHFWGVSLPVVGLLANIVTAWMFLKAKAPNFLKNNL